MLFETIEKKLDSTGKPTYAQLLRLLETKYINCFNLSTADWCRRVIACDIDGRQVVQREARLQEKVNALRKVAHPPESLSSQESEELEALE